METGAIKTYKPLGIKTLLMMILAESYILLVMLLLFFAFVIFINYMPSIYFSIGFRIFSIYRLALIFVLILTFLLGCLRYYRYGIFLYEKSFKISQGLFSIKEVGIPYRRIQDITIHRSLIDQLFGISNIVITVLGLDEREAAGSDNSEKVILPSLDKKVAADIQETILRRAQVEQINILDHITVKPHQDSN